MTPRRAALAAAAILVSAAPAWPYAYWVFENSTGVRVPLRWATPDVDYYVDAGGTGVAGADAFALTDSGLQLWNRIASSDLNFRLVGATSADIDSGDLTTVQDPFFGEQVEADPFRNEVIIDSDGAILAEFFGGDPFLLGIALPRSDEATGRIRAANFVMFASNMNLATAAGRDLFVAVLAHEAGHTVGFAHTPTAPDDPQSDPNRTPLMYPFAVQTVTTLLPDDTAVATAVYPSATVDDLLGRVSGRVHDASGAELFGAVVELFPVDDPEIPVVGALSGQEDFEGPRYRIRGVPPGRYYARIEPVSVNFEPERIGGIFDAVADGFDTEVFFHATTFTNGIILDVSAGEEIENVNFGLLLPDEFNLAISYPNPLRLDLGQTATIRTDPAVPISSIRIYSLDGRKILERTGLAAATSFAWNGRSDDGDVVASGTYVYVIHGVDGTVSRGRLTLLK